MKNSVAIFVTVLLLSAKGYSQCTPLTATGNPGLTPAPANVTCIEQGVFYDFTLYFENFTDFNCSGFTADVNYSEINNLSNLPCGLTWQPDQTSYSAGETGCIRISGTSTDAIGQYALEVFMTVDLDIFGSSYTVSGSIAQLENQLQQAGCSSTGVNTAYYSRVVAPGTSPCPAIGSMTNRTSSGTTCPPVISVSISGNDTICSGSSTTLTANVSNATGAVTYTWNPGGGSAQIVDVLPTVTTPYSVTVTDQNGSATASATVTVIQLCDDGDACTTDECIPGTGCTATPIVCDDNDVCTTDGCDPATGCSTTAITCNDGDLCTTDGCDPATGCTTTGVVCDDGDACTSDTCDAGCVYTPIVPCTVGIVNTDNSLSVEIYPNPTSGTFEMRLNNTNEDEFLLNIFDLSGKKHYSEAFSAATGNTALNKDLSGLSKGIYIFNLSSGEISINKKLVIY